MDKPGRTDKSSQVAWQGLPQTPHSALTPTGEIEQAGKIADGLRYRRKGWRRWVVLTGGVLLGICAVIIIAARAGGAG